MTEVTRPVLRWHGGKFRLAPWIIEHFPAHRVYVEPYGGAASVLLRKPRSYSEVYNDLDGDAVNLFRVLRDPEQAARLRELLRLTPFARTEFMAAYEPSDEPVERARRLVARSFMGHSSKGAFERSGFDTRVNSDGYCSRVNAVVALPEAVDQAVERLRGVLIENDQAMVLIDRHDRPDALFYIDPPYLPQTRGSRVYREDMSRADHEALLDRLQSVDGMVVLSGYPSALYDEALKGWTRRERTALADGARKRTEVLWLNPACVAALEAENHQPRLIAEDAA